MNYHETRVCYLLCHMACTVPFDKESCEESVTEIYGLLCSKQYALNEV